jgi:hypothetical protein
VGFILGFVPLPSFCMLMGSYLLEGTWTRENKDLIFREDWGLLSCKSFPGL